MLLSLNESQTSLSTLSKKDIELLNCPSNILLAEFMKRNTPITPTPSLPSSDGGNGKVIVPKVKGGKSGGFGADAEDLAWEEQVRAELEEKKRVKLEAEAESLKIQAVKVVPKVVTKSKKQKKEEEELAALGLGGVTKPKKKKDSAKSKSTSSSGSSSVSSSSTGAASGGVSSSELEKESDAREKTREVIVKAKACLQALSTCALALSTSRHSLNGEDGEGDGLKGQLLCQFLEPVYSLLKFSLLHDEVYKCIKVLVTCLDDRFKHYHGTAATCLRLSVCDSHVDVEMMTSFCTDMYNIVRSRGSSPFTPSTVQLVFFLLYTLIICLFSKDSLSLFCLKYIHIFLFVLCSFST